MTIIAHMHVLLGSAVIVYTGLDSHITTTLCPKGKLLNAILIIMIVYVYMTVHHCFYPYSFHRGDL